MIRSDGRLAVVLCVQMFGLLAYNYAGVLLTIIRWVLSAAPLRVSDMFPAQQQRSTQSQLHPCLIVLHVASAHALGAAAQFSSTMLGMHCCVSYVSDASSGAW